MKMSWDDAFAFCKKQNSRLFEADSDEAYNFLKSARVHEALFDVGVDAIWLGFKSK